MRGAAVAGRGPATRMSSSASGHNRTWARMRSSRWWNTGRSAGRPSCRAIRLHGDELPASVSIAAASMRSDPVVVRRR